VIVLVCAGCLIAGLVIAATGSPHFNWWQNSSLYGFLPCWWIGAAFAMTKRPPGLKFIAWTSAAWLALTLVCLVDPTALFSEIRKISFSLLTGVAILALENCRAPNLAKHIGQAGYSIYALHAPILYSLVLLGVAWYACIVACLLVGLCLFHAIERPLDRMGHVLAKRHA